eukprot:1672939-Pyramimonas_sp.AAC.1
MQSAVSALVQRHHLATPPAPPVYLAEPKDHFRMPYQDEHFPITVMTNPKWDVVPTHRCSSWYGMRKWSFGSA